jgi:PsbP-like protein
LTYTNTDFGFTMKYPSDWTVDDKNLTLGIKFTSPDGPGVGAVLVGITLEDLANSLPSNQSHRLKLIEMDKSGYFLSGHPALRIIFSQSGVRQGAEPYDVKLMGFVVVLGGKEYVIVYAARPESFPNQLQTAQTMIDSFQIISKQ